MEGRKPFLLDSALFYWNLFLAAFSLMGFLRMSPEMYWSINSNSFTYSICTASYAQGVTGPLNPIIIVRALLGFWTEQFAMSKVFEFADTAFIVLRKRPLIFLHWYHHVTVLVYTWHAYKDHTASGRWFIWMNYAVSPSVFTNMRHFRYTPLCISITLFVRQRFTFLNSALCSLLFSKSFRWSWASTLELLFTALNRLDLRVSKHGKTFTSPSRSTSLISAYS